MSEVIIGTDLPLDCFQKNHGKVRDTYELNDNLLLIVTTDRISAFDAVLSQGIPDKGKILNQMSLFWFDLFRQNERRFFSDHLHQDEDRQIEQIFRESVKDNGDIEKYLPILNQRSMVVKKLKVLPVECIVRGYIAGSGWKDYQKTGRICGQRLPFGLKEGQEIPDGPIFTPSTKAAIGQHDENIQFSQMVDIIHGWVTMNMPICSSSAVEIAVSLDNASRVIYRYAHDYARQRGVIIADTKLEFGLLPWGELVLVDEVLTPDSSRFWPVDDYTPGRPQKSFDKQFVRDYLEGTGWDKKSTPPDLPDEVIKKTTDKYKEVFGILTGRVI